MVVAAVVTLALGLAGCQGERHVIGKRHVGTTYYVDCQTGFKDGPNGKKEAVIVHQVVTKAAYDKAAEGGDC